MVPDTDVAAAVALPHIAFARCAPIASSASSSPLSDDEAWLAACHRLTPRVERVAPACALLDLGACSDREAIDALRAFHARLHAHSIRVRLGLGPTATLAQLALLTAPAGQTLAQVPHEGIAAFLRAVPVAALDQLHPAGRTATPALVERLQRYGLRTLGHLARLPEAALRRQFGAAAGAFLAAVARGDDPTPLHPTAAPAWLRFRLRVDLPAPLGRVAAALPTVAAHLADALHRAGRRAQAVRVRVERELGGVASTEHRLREPTDDARTLAAELHRALVALMAGDEHNGGDGGGAIAGLRVALGDLAPAWPEQTTLWRAGAARRREALARLAGIGDGLARRHGRDMLGTLPVVAPDAIFDEHRYRAALVPPPRGEPPRAEVSQRPAPAAIAADAWDGVPHGIHWW